MKTYFQSIIIIILLAITNVFATESTKLEVPPPIPVEDDLSKDAIATVIGRSMGDIQHCFENRIDSNPKMQGKVVTSFIIQPSGYVTNVHTQYSELQDLPTENCINQTFFRMIFPARVQGIIDVSYPLVFSRKDK